MAQKTAILSLKIVSDASGARKGVDETLSHLDKLQARMSKLTMPATAIVAGIGSIAVSAGKMASEAQQNFGAVDAVFKNHARAVQDMAKNSAQTLGLSSSDYAKYSALLGAQLKNAGVPLDQLAGQTNKLIGYGADFAAQFGGTVPEAVEALSSALKGEMDPIEKFGISLNQSAIDAELARMGMSGLTGAAEQQAKAQAIMNIIQTQGADAMGAFGRETGSAAGQQAIATAAWADASAQLGTVLLPIMTQAALVLADVAKWVQENSTLVTTLAVVFGGLAAAVLAINGVLAVHNAITGASVIAKGAATIATGAWTGATALLGLAMRALPIITIITAILAFASAIKWAYENVGWFRDAVNAVGRFAVDAFNNISRAVQTAINWVRNLFNGFSIPGWMRQVMNFMGMGGTGFDISLGYDLNGLDAGTGATGGFFPGMFTASGTSTEVHNHTYNITINGVIDKQSAGREIDSIMKQYARTSGRTSAAGGFNN